MPTSPVCSSAFFAVNDLRTRQLRVHHLHIPEHRCLCLQGESGSGKTLLLRAIADLDENQGEVCLQGRPRSDMSADQWRQTVVLVPAESAWWAESVGAHAQHWPLDLFPPLGFDQEVLNWQVSRLSTGERQRLALLRALALSPQMLLLDEPTANLDEQHTRAVESVILSFLKHHGCAAIWVSHNTEQCQRIGWRKALMQAGRLLWPPGQEA